MVDSSRLIKLTVQANTNTNSVSNTNTNSSNSSNKVSTQSNNSEGVKRSIKMANGDVHSMVIDETGQVWDYNETDGDWVTREDNQVFLYDGDSETIGETVDLSNININSVKITSGSTIKTYKLQSGTSIEDVDGKAISDIQNLSAQKDTNDYADGKYTVAVIDNFVEKDELGLTHAQIVSAVLKSDNDDNDVTNNVNVISYNVATQDPEHPDDPNATVMNYSDIWNAFDAIERRVANGESIDAINMSIGIPYTLQELGLEDISLSDLNDPAKCAQVIAALNDPDLERLINKITEVASKGIEIYISSGNDSDDVQYAKGEEGYNYYQSYDKDGDGVITGRELGVFNAFSLAMGNNVHVIGATSSSGEFGPDENSVADYSDINGTVDAYYDGDVRLSYLGQNAQGKYMWDVDSDGLADIYSNTAPEDTEVGDEYLECGTSFSSPFAAKKNDSYLA